MNKGIWFFGYSGCGKTFASKFLKKKIKNSILIDGDEVRKYISFDLGYSLENRKTQIQRICGLLKILLKTQLFPIISTVYFDKRAKKFCLKNKIFPIKILRKNMKNIFRSHKTYKNKSNIVGFDIQYPKILTKNIYNNGDKNFCKKLTLLIP
jgi:adenylylsulfate kinase-like enzyme